MSDALEAWLRGPLPGVPPLLQPIAHALVQARDEIGGALRGFPDDALDARPGGVASARFHLRHVAGVLDRLTTYARGEALTDAQLARLDAEALPGTETTGALVDAVGDAVEAALAELRATDPATLTEPRGVGRERVPSTVMGLLVHAAEHTTRHTGQLLVTAAWVRAAYP